MPSYRQKFEGESFILLRIHRATYERQYAYVDKRRKIIIKGERGKRYGETRSEKAHDMSRARAPDYIIILTRYPSRIVAVIPSIINTCLGSISYASFLPPPVCTAPYVRGLDIGGARGPTAALGCEAALSIARTTRREPRAGPYGPHGVINTPDGVCVYTSVYV